MKCRCAIRPPPFAALYAAPFQDGSHFRIDCPPVIASAAKQSRVTGTKLGVRAVFDVPVPIHIFWCWILLGGKEELRGLVAQVIEPDDMFIKALAAMRMWVNSSKRGLYQRLDSQIAGELLDLATVRQRLEGLKNTGGLSVELQKVGKELLETWDER